jgi:hypothetical protein
MTIKKTVYTRGIILKADDIALEGIPGELKTALTAQRLQVYIQGATREVITADQTQTLTNKTINADVNTISNLEVDNLKAGVLDTDLSSVSASDDTLPSAKAVKTALDAENTARTSADNTLQSNIDAHINDTTAAHAASAVSNTPAGNLSSTTVQGALNELQSDIDAEVTARTSAVGTVQSNLDAHLNDTVDAHDASAISNIPSGNLAATDVQGAVNELQSDIDTRALNSDLIAHTSTSAAHGATGAVVGTTNTQTLINKTLTAPNVDVLNLAQQTTPATPTSGNAKVYVKADNKAYILNSTGVETALGTGSGGVSDPDFLLVQSFDTATTADFTQTGLTFETSAPLNGVQSAKLTHQAATSQSFKQTIFVSPKFRGINATVALIAKSTATSGNVTISFRDETNNAVIGSSEIIAATSSIQTFQFGVAIPATCASLSYTVTALQQSGSPITLVDDIQIRNYWLGTSVQGQTTHTVDVPVETDWAPATFSTLAWQGLGSVTSNLLCKRQGGDLLISGHFTAGTVAAAEARLSLPTWNGSQLSVKSTTKSLSLIGSNYRSSAAGAVSLSTSGSGLFQATALDTFVTFGFHGASNSGTTKQQGSAIFVTGEDVRVNIRIPIEGWDATEKKSFTSTDLVPAKAVLGNTSIDVPVVTAWQSYVPTFQGFGSPSAIEFEWRQVADSVEIRGKFVSGVSTSVEARVSLPNGYTSAGTSVIPSIAKAGEWTQNIAISGNGHILIEPSVGYITFGYETGTTPGLTKVPATTIIASGTSLSLTTCIPVSGLSATKNTVLGLAQTGVIQDGDSSVRVSNTPGKGSTGTAIVRFSNIQDSIGSDITYSQSSINGDSFTVLSDGIYNLSFSYVTSSNGDIGISKNQSNLTTTAVALSEAERLCMAELADTGINYGTVSTSVKLSKNDVIRAVASTATSSAANCQFTISKQGSLKQINVNANQKATIPTHELRFEGSSSRGSTATAIVKFDTLAKIRGDGFTVLNDTVNGTAITITKAGLLNVSSSFDVSLTNSVAWISVNQSVLTAQASASEMKAVTQAYTASATISLGSSFFVSVGDIVRIGCSTGITADTRNSLNLTLQEQQVQVSVSNTLPQFSDVDSHVRVSSANGFGSTNTTTRRFSNIEANVGSDIVYTDDASLGGSFTVMKSGIYQFNYNDYFNAAKDMAIIKNSGVFSAITYLAYGSAAAGIVGSVAGTAYLNAGDVVRAMVSTAGAAAGNNYVSFSISKVGKPNVTGVDVTPFVNIPQFDFSEIRFEGASARGSTANAIVKFDTLAKIKGDGFAVTNTAVDGTYVTMTKAGRLSVTAGFALASGETALLSKNQAVLTGFPTAAETLSTSSPGVGARTSVSWTGDVVVGDIIRVVTSLAPTSNAANNFTLSLQANSAQILQLHKRLVQIQQTYSMLLLLSTHSLL